MAKRIRAWAVFAQNKIVLPSIKFTKREFTDWINKWCAGKERAKRLLRDGCYNVRKIEIREGWGK